MRDVERAVRLRSGPRQGGSSATARARAAAVRRGLRCRAKGRHGEAVQVAASEECLTAHLAEVAGNRRSCGLRVHCDAELHGLEDDGSLRRRSFERRESTGLRAAAGYDRGR